jgi:vacuolar-type H+-ATPase subunit H
MGMMDKAKEMKDKAVHAAKERAGKDDSVDKAAEKAKGATGHKYDEHIDKAAEKANQKNDQM